MDSLLKRGIEDMLTQKYELAQKDFESLKTKYPLLPLGDIYLSANEIAKSFDLNIQFDEDTINENLNRAIDKAEILYDKDENIYNYYMIFY